MHVSSTIAICVCDSRPTRTRSQGAVYRAYHMGRQPANIRVYHTCIRSDSATRGILREFLHRASLLLDRPEIPEAHRPPD